MNLFQAVVLGVVQGLTEFLPVSSSAHLALFPWLLGWEDPGLRFSVALHLGTLAAVLGFFWRDWTELLKAAIQDPKGPRARLFFYLVLATIPAGLAGLLLKDLVAGPLRSPAVMACSLIFFGAWLGWADRTAAAEAPLDRLTLKNALLIGASQALALLPGVSRSGITVTAGLMEGLTREAALRFSFLLSAPIVAAAALSELKDMSLSEVDSVFVAGILSAGVTGALAIKVLMTYNKKAGFQSFVVYRFALGAAILAVWFVRR